MASIVAAILTIASLATARSALGADIGSWTTNENVVVTESMLSGGDALFVYTDTTASFTISSESTLGVWLLVVGGGGAGGYSQTTANLKGSYGAGGGGGGGGLIETNGLKLASGTYTITVGAGGPAPTKSGNNGGDGNPSVFAGPTGSGVLFNALGGGGGAASGKAGSDGGSGGGGSYNAGEFSGGSALNDGAQGHVGGSGGAKGGGAGGGGAGGAGGPITSDYHAGQGGAGVVSAIDGSSVIYAAGGGGGSNDYMGSGGAGDGTGNGAGTSAATSGADGRGGGGGGGDGKSRPGAKGGSGVVIIRVTKIYGEITPPVGAEFTYTGLQQTIWVLDPECTLSADSDDLNRTDVGDYKFTVEPSGDAVWKGGGRDPITVYWSIKKATDIGLTISQDGWIEGSPVDAVVTCALYGVSPVVTYSKTDDKAGEYYEPGTKPTSPGNYWVKATVDGTGNYDGAAAGPVAFRILGANESPIASLGFYVPITFQAYVGPGEATVTFTPAVANYQTKDNSTSALCLCSANGRIYPQSIEWTAGNMAELTVEFDDLSPDRTFYLCWGLVEGESEPTIPTTSKTGTAISPNTDTVVVRDTSKTLQNYIRDLAMQSWRVGETPSEPEYRYKIGIPTLRYVGTGGYDSSAKPTEPDSYTLTVTIPEETGTANYGPYSGASASVEFKVLGTTDTPFVGGSLKYFATVTAASAVSAGNVTVDVPSTHDWVAAYNDGKDVRFCDIDGNVYPSGLSSWNGDGSARFLVQVPSMAAGDKFYMCWGETVGKSVPAAEAPTGATSAGTFTIGSTVSDPSLKLKNWIDGLSMTSFRAGYQAPVPSCTNKIGDVVYKFSIYQTTQFSEAYDPANPPNPGSYYLRAEVAGTDDYAAATSEAIAFRVLGETESPLNALAYFTPVTVSGSLDAPVRVTVTLPASLDYRTIFNNGSDIRFCDSDGKVLPSSMTNWATNGTGKASVQIPAFSSSYVFYICWGPVVGQTVPGTSTPTAADSAITPTVGATIRDDTKWPLVNHWVTQFDVSARSWAKGDVSAGRVTYTAGYPAYGSFKLLCRNVATDEETITTELPDNSGDYELIAFADSGEDGNLRWAGITNSAIEVSITEHNPTISVTRYHGAEGRVLLMNTDVTPGYEIYNQGYADNDPSYSTFWEHSKPVTLPTVIKNNFNISNESASVLWTTDKARRLWSLTECHQGNIFRKNDALQLSTYNFLPWDSEYARDIDAHESNSHTRHGAGQIVMMNTTNACVYSSCFTGGVGTVYFDAVNSGKVTSSVLAEYFRLKVWIATDCVTSFGEVVDVAPTDEYVHEFDGDDVVVDSEAVVTNANWRAIPIVPIRIENGTVATPYASSDKVDVAELDIAVGGTANNYYRMVVPLDIKGPVRFKIQRESDAGGAVDQVDKYIILDNIIVSYPAMRSAITTYGEDGYDPERTGKQVIGMPMALSEAFPSVDSTDVRGRGKVTHYTNEGVENPATNDFIVSARFNYRWRYLNQSFYHGDGEPSSTDDGTFASVRLSPVNDWMSTKPLNLPEGLVGDIEYWYELVLGAPYYEYHDYSGLDAGVGGYSEEIPTCTYSAPAGIFGIGPAPSGGTNWFVRIREGASQYDKMALIVDDTSSGSLRRETIYMDLVGSHQWRGFVPVTNKAERALSFYIKGENPQVDGATVFDDGEYNYDEFRASVTSIDISNGPYAGTMVKVGEDVGTVASIHYLTNVASYIEFQFNDATRAISISHADYQNFNEWFSSRFKSDQNQKFYSSAHETNSTSIATKRYPAEATNKVISTFAETPRTATAWHEEFKLTGAQTLAGYPMNEPFPTGKARTPKGWLAENGMWVAQKWGMTNSTDFAYQMEGCGRGSVTFNLTPVPNGLDTIDFTTRLAQFNEFDNISYNWKSYMRQNYTIAAQACFDTDPQFRNFSGEASISLIAGYQPKKGCYEYRVTIYNVDEPWKSGSTTITRATCRHSIIKWSLDGAKLVPTTLVEVLNTDSGGWYWTKDGNNPTKGDLIKQLPLGPNGTQYSGMYMSFSNASDRVIITAGVTGDKVNKQDPNVDFTYTDKTFYQIGCEDASDTRFKRGTYGVLIKNCPGRILFPRIYDKNRPIPDAGTDAREQVGDGFRWQGKVPMIAEAAAGGNDAEKNEIGEYWALEPGRTVELSGARWGLEAAPGPKQDIGVYTMPVGSSENWTCLTNLSVNTFNNESHTITLQSTQECQVMFKSSAPRDDIRTDIIIDGITLTQWCGQSGSSTNASTSYGYADDFYYTGSWISNRVDSAKKTQRVALLAPRRAESPNSPIGIRSPYMNGLGAIIFKYCDAGEGAELELQKWTGAVGSLYSHLDDAQDASGWTTLTNWTFTAGESGTKSFYYGLRAPSNGVFRLVIPQSKVRTAYAHPEYDPNWGAITIADVYCHDEPAFDSHSWWGWNFLTTGWNDGTGNNFAAIDDSMAGAVGVLNNKLDKDSLQTGDPNDYNMNDPFIQSPTFNNRNVGEIAFRARKYDTSSSAEKSYITVWGAKSGDMQKGVSWTAITNVPIDSVSYTRHVVKCADEQGFAAIRLGVAKVQGIMDEYTMKPAEAAELPAVPVRVLVDEIVIRERVKPEVGFRLDFVRPFRLGLSERTAVPNIASRDQQPLLNEQFGFQAEVEVTGLADEVDLDRTPEVRISLYPKAKPWGYENWKDADGAVLDILLEPAEGTNLIFRSMSTTPLSFTGPFEADPDLGYGIVQYYLTVTYWDKGGDAHPTKINKTQWQMPSWYQGFDDPNARPDAKFSPFTVLDTVSPGRAWFNEVNFSDSDGSNAKQFIEVCFPAGYDMTGWRIYRYDVWGKSALLAALGLTTGVPASKAATGGDPNFAFFALTDKDFAVAGADAFWNQDIAGCDGLGASYGFQLVRPSGIIEQQIVVQGNLGTSPWGQNKSGTNVVAELSRRVGGTWEFVGADTNAAVKSSGVFQNAGALPADWNDVMDMTPGMKNGDQTIPSDWFLPPSGTNVWLSLSTLGAYVWVVDGEDRVPMKTIVVPQGTTTNLVFETAPWHQLGSLVRDATNDVTAAAVRSAGTARTNVWTYAFREDERNSATLVASARPDEDALARGGLDLDDPYTPAVMKWLLEGTANGEPFEGDEISTNCFFWGLSAGARPVPLPLKDRYWLDIDPTSDAWDLRGGMGEFSNLSAPTPTVPVVAEVRRDRPMIWPERLTNRVVTVALMISNKVDNARSRAPNRLQGLGGEKSDVVGAKNWTSETFKVTMSLIKPEGAPGIDVGDSYWPMATFVFDENSFGASDGPHPFSARIEVADPMTKASPAYTYGWWKFPGSTYGYKWDLSHGTYMRDPTVLTTTNTWDKTWEATSDW